MGAPVVESIGRVVFASCTTDTPSDEGDLAKIPDVWFLILMGKNIHTKSVIIK